MQPEDLAPIAEVIAETVKAATASMLARLESVEAREPIHGKDGEKGTDGKNGTDGKDGASVPDSVLDEWREKLASVEARLPELIAPSDLSAAVEAEFRKELALVVSSAPLMKKRIVRDAQGRVESVVDEPIV